LQSQFPLFLSLLKTQNQQDPHPFSVKYYNWNTMIDSSLSMTVSFGYMKASIWLRGSMAQVGQPIITPLVKVQ
jgi:CDP-glycerol glycerophosphotransferase (TagB/SpsB family)